MDEKPKKIPKLKLKIFLNTITALRGIGALFLVPIYLTYGAIVTSLTMAGLAVTDFIDGKMARGFHIETMLGSFLDVMADKLLGITCLGILAFANPIFAIPLICETTIGLINVLHYKYNSVLKSRITGKIKMWPLSVGVSLGMLSLDIPGLHNMLNAIGISVPSLSFITDFINNNLLAKLVNVPVSSIANVLAVPIIICELIVIVDYGHRLINVKKDNVVIDEKKYDKKPLKEVLYDALDTDYYHANKDKPLKLILKKEKSN